MDWLEFILSAFGGSILAGLGSIMYFRPRLKKAKAESSKAETEAADLKHDYLEERIESMEKLYSKQGEVLDEVRTKMLELGKELQAKDERINQLESENRSLVRKVDKLEKEVEAYKTISKANSK